MTGYMDPSNWRYGRRYPGGDTSECTTSGLTGGEIIIWERRPYRVLEVTPRPFVNWKPSYIEGWEQSGRPDPETWRYRPFALVLTPEFAADIKRQHLEAPGDHRWTVLPEHFSVCRLCQELAPCKHVVDEAVMDHAMKQMQQDMAILPGFCHECLEPITRRQGMIRFEGPNLIRPDLGDDSAVFHTRRACLDGPWEYDKRWAAAVPGRRRKLYCDGHLTRHADGTSECSEGGLCPNPEVNHGSLNTHYFSAGPNSWSGCWCVAGDAAVKEAAR